MNELDQSAFRAMRARSAAPRSWRVAGTRWGRRLFGTVACAALGGVAASCDASKALQPGKAKSVRIDFNGDSTLVVGSVVPVQFDVIVDGKPYAFPRLEVESSDTGVITLADDGRSLVARRRGRASVTVRFISAVLPEPPAVEQQIYVVAQSARIDRAAVTLTSFGDTAHLVVSATDANDEPLPTLVPKWISSDAEVASVSADGVVTARKNGTAEVRAVVDFDTVLTTVTVQQRLARFSFPMSAVPIDALGAEARLEVVGLDARGNPITTVSGAGALWDVANGKVASITPSGMAVALTNGETWARASAVGGVVRDSVRLVVSQRAMKVVISTPGPLTLAAISAKAKLEALGFDRLDRQIANNIPSWVSRNPRVAHVDTLTANVTAIDTGSTWLLARMDGAADSIEVRVTNAPTRVTLDSHARTLSSVGDTLRLTAKAENAEQAPIPGWPLAWHSTDTAVVRVLGDGRAVAVGAGVARVVVAAVGSDVADTAAITVTNLVARADVIPTSVVLESIGDTLVLPVTLENARGLPITDRTAVSWKSEESDVVRVTATGWVIALQAGSSIVRAIGPEGSGVRDSVTVVVTNAPASIVLATHADTMTAVGKRRSYAYEVRNRRGTLIADYPVQWSTRRAAVATVSPEGSVVAAGEGVTWIVAGAGAVADSLEVTVGNVPTSLVLDRDAATMTSVGDTVLLRATARNEEQVAVPSLPLSWHTPDSSIVRLDPARPGAVVARAPGTTLVIVSYGTIADTAVVTVVNAAARVNLVPVDTLLTSVGDTARPSIEIYTTRGIPLARSAVLWTTDDLLVARVTAGGDIIARDTGSVMVHATSAYFGTVTDSILVVVRNVPASVALSEQRVSLTAVGRTHAMTAEVRNARGALIAGAPLSWRSTVGRVATVSTAGVVTAAGVGTTLIVAQSGAVADTAELTVADVPASVELPASVTVSSVGDTVALRAVVRNEMGLEIVGAPIVWSTLEPTIARVLDDGRVVTLSYGNARIVAVSGTAADTVTVVSWNLVESVDIIPTSITMASLLDTLSPPIKALNARGADLGRSAVNWSSDDGSIATVSASGIVRARGVGTTIVRAVSPTAVDRRDSVFVVVTNAPVSIVLSAHVDSLTAVSMQRSYTAEVRNAAGALVTSPLPTWRSTATAVATVNGLGTVTAIGAGSALIIAQAGAVADTLRLAVADRATQVTVTPKTLTVPSVGDTLRLTASVLNSAGRTVAGAVPAWHSTDPGVTQVLADGRVIGTGAGTARVVASYDPLADTVTVTVTNAPVSVDIGPTTLAFVALGDSTQPAFDARNSRGNLLPATSLIWTSDDPAIARVSAGAMISARDIGRTVVRATSPFNSALRDSVVVTVTNDPASVVLDGAAADTLTAGLQSLTYTATARNIRGALLPPSTVTWRSTNSPVAAVTAGGVVTSMGAWGSALVIAQAGDFADTVAIVVTNLTRLYVDNGVFAATRAGTGTRPFARIQDAVNAADAGDTVVVRPGVTGYSEAVSLGRRITLIGDSTAFVANGRDPLRLPRVSHDLGSGGIVANTPGSSFVIRYFAVQNTVDGAAVAVLGASNTILEYLYVNPGTQPFRSGSGIVVENVTGSAMVVRSTVQSVVGYGVRLRNVQNGRVESVTVRDVGTSFTDEGVGVQVLRGANNRVVGTTVRRTEGPQFAFDTTSNVVVSGNDLAGEQALLRVAATSGLVTIDGNAFDLRRQSGDPAPVGPSTGRAGLAVRAASGVTVSNNTFTDVAGSVSQIDPVRLSDARPTGGAAAAVTLSSNRFTGGRHAIHSERSTWLMTSSRFDNPGVAVYATESDSVTMIGDTVSTAGAGCVQLLGASSLLDVLHSAFVECSADGTAAVTATGAAAVVGVDSSAFVGANQRVVSAPQARFVSLRGNTLSGAGTLTLATAQRTVGAVDAAATDSIRFVANDVREYRVYAAASLRAATVRADSNFVSRNLAGLRLGSAVTALVRDNSFFDNDALATTQNRGALGLANDGTAAIAVGSNWWGDDRGPQRAANALAVGDSATGLGLPPATFAAQPIPTHQGVGAPAGIRMVRGDSQSVRKGTALPRKLTVRVVDAVGRPLAGTAANVQFTVVSGGGTLTGAATNGVLTVTPNASGLAEASFTTPGVNGICKVSATVGTQSVTFTVTSTP